MLDYVIHALGLCLIVSLPAALVYTTFNFIFWGLPLGENKRRIAFFALLQSFVTDAVFGLLPSPVRPLSFLLITIAVYFFVFRGQSVSLKAKMVSSFIFTYLLIEFTLSVLFVNPENAVTLYRQWGLLFISEWPVMSVLSILAYLMHKKRIHPGISISRQLSRKESRIFLYLLAFIAFQLLLLLCLFITDILNHRQAFYMIQAIISAISISLVFLSIRVLGRSKEDAVTMTQKVYIDDLNDMFTTIRGQRHDLLNHLQVMQAFIKLDKIAELRQYVTEMVGEIVSVNDIIKIGHPALAALMQSKLARAMERKVEIRHSFSGLEELTLGAKSVDIVKIAGNLIDNAIDEAENLEVPQRWVEIRGWAEGGNLLFTVRNPGRVLSDRDLNMLFVPGYTTKDSKSHSGLGLSIVKERVTHYKGEVEIESDRNGLHTFKVRIPIASA